MKGGNKMKKIVFVLITLFCFFLIACNEKQDNEKMGGKFVDNKINLESKRDYDKNSQEQEENFDKNTQNVENINALSNRVNHAGENGENEEEIIYDEQSNMETSDIMMVDDYELVDFINNFDDKYTYAINSFHGYPIRFSFKNGITKALVNVEEGSLELYDLVKSKEVYNNCFSWYMDHEKEREESGYITYLTIIFEDEKYILGFAVLKISYIYDAINYYDYYKGEVLKSSIFPEIHNEKQSVTYDQVLELISIAKRNDK